MITAGAARAPGACGAVTINKLETLGTTAYEGRAYASGNDSRAIQAAPTASRKVPESAAATSSTYVV